jgi:flagellar hook-associated protein 2
MSSITAPTYDPTSTAQALAQKSTAAAQQNLTTQTKTLSATSAALSKLNGMISAFQSSLSGLTGASKTMLAQSAALSDTSFGSASANGHAVAGSYDFFVEQIATAGKTTYSNLSDTTGITASPGTLTVKLGGASGIGIDVDLAAAAGDGTLTVRELAAAINNATGNGGKVAASVVTIGLNSQLVLTSTQTGAATGISLDLSQMDPTSTLTAALQNTANVSATTPQDAAVYVGAHSGTPVTQASNTFTNVDGLAVTFTKAQAMGDPNLTVTVKTDTSTTTSRAQAFVDAYNKLKTAIDALVAPANGNTGEAAGAFAGDASIKALQSRMVSLLRPAAGTSLASFGITFQRDGSLGLDPSRLSKQLALTPDGLDRVLGSTAAGGASGVATVLNTYLNQWGGGTGWIQHRQDATTKLQSALASRQDSLDRSYDAAYARYLKQFTDLQALQSTMNSNVSMFDALFGNAKSN